MLLVSFASSLVAWRRLAKSGAVPAVSGNGPMQAVLMESSAKSQMGALRSLESPELAYAGRGDASESFLRGNGWQVAEVVGNGAEEAVGAEGENAEGGKTAEGAGGDRTHQADAWQAELHHGGVAGVAGDTDPAAGGGVGVPLDARPVGDPGNEGQKCRLVLMFTRPRREPATRELVTRNLEPHLHRRLRPFHQRVHLSPALGRRWLQRMTRAPQLMRYLMVGTAALTRVSSVILRLSSRGTFRSTLTNTRLPLRSASFSVDTLLFVAICDRSRDNDERNKLLDPDTERN